MADTTQATMNGTYPAPYPDPYAMNNSANFQPTHSSTPSNAPPAEQIAKDEVGWYFVEQYYTNMSRSPERLHLFYSRRSQFVFGTEAESVPVVVGSKAINDKIKDLDFQECKVRVLNVDSQASGNDSILISVIGEISNKSEPSRKFIQTFVLATQSQPNGYYVLNDIFRYLTEEEEEFPNEEPTPAVEPQQPQQQEEQHQAPEAQAQPSAPETAPATEAQVDNEPAATVVDEKLEEAKPDGETAQPSAAPQTNGHAEPQEAAAEPAPAPAAESTQADYPPSPETTPTATAPKEDPAEKQAPAPTPAKAVPKTWANIASKSGATAPVVPAIPVAPPKAPAANSAQPAAPAAAPAPASAQQPAAASAAASAEPTPNQPYSNDNAGWQTAGHDHKKSQSRAGDDQVLGYIKNVTNKVDAKALQEKLSSFGKLKYFDVSRQKNCAFVEFAEPAGYAAAVAANPHQVGTEQIVVEERRPRPNAYNYGPGRGGAGRGRGDRTGSQGRGGFQRDGRSGFAPRGRGNMGPKGRNQPQAA